MPRQRSKPARVTKATGHEPKQSAGRLRRLKRNGEDYHALVGGWSQRHGKFIGLLLGVREGRRRKLTYVGVVETPTDTLAMTFLEGQLREMEVESSPFADDIPSADGITHHWIAPELVAEIGFSGWTRSKTLSRPSLKAISERTSFRHAQWLAPPKSG